MARLCLSLLGPFQATLDGAPLTGFPSAKVRALLAYLAVESGRRRTGAVAHPRQVLAGLLWPDYPDRSAHTNLSNALSHLRTLLRDRADTGGEYSSPVRPYLVVDRETVQFNADSDAWVDVLEFEGNLQPETQNTKLATPDSQLETCVRLYRGPFLDGFSVKDSPPFEQWTLLTRERLQRQALEALGKLSAHWEQRGEYRRALAYAQQQLDLEPWRESAHRQAMRALALSGQRDAALAQYEACVRALKDELDVAPAVETTRLWEQIRHGTLAVGTPRPKTETEARFLADWVVAEPGPRHNLPAQVTSFVGRERELIELSRMLAEPEVRLVTVVGPGGMGKTRLALQASRAALDQAAVAEAWLVDLAPVVDGAAVERAVAAALGVHEQPGRLLPETIAGALQARKLLLVMDNCEHVLESIAPLVALLLARCPELSVLATSREPLRVPGEQLYEAPPMALPASSTPAGQLLDTDAVQLFCRRAASVRPGFTLDDQSAPLAVEVCRRLDGMPLAIELAAARLRALSLPDLARHLDDRFRLLAGGSRTALPRQQTLRNAVAWSYDLLTEAERLAFDRVSVFAGSFGLEAAEAVCSGDGMRQEEVLDLLAGLVDKSLVARVEGPEGATRYRLLETLRAYGQERLGQRGAVEEVTERHAWYYVSLAEAEEPALWEHERDAILVRQRLNAEAENLAAAIRWSLARRQPEVALRIGGALYFWTFVRANNEQYAEWLRQALAQGEQVAPLYRAKAWWMISVYAANWGWIDEQATAAQTAFDLARAAGDATWIGRTLWLVGSVADGAGDRAQARSYYEQSLALSRQCGDRVFIMATLSFLAEHERPTRRRVLLEELLEQAPYCGKAWMLRSLGWTTWALGDLEGAQAHFQAAVAGFVEQDDPVEEGGSWVPLARIAAQGGDYRGAERMLQRGRDLYRQVGQFNTVLWATREMGRLAWMCGDLEKASSRFRECLDLAREHRYPREAALARISLALVAGERGEYDQAEAPCEQALPDLPPADDEAWVMALCAQGRIALGRGEAARAVGHYRAALARLRAGESRPDICEVLEFLGWALAADGQHAAAAPLLAFAEQERAEIGIVLPPVDWPRHDRALGTVRAALGEHGFAAAWAEGRALGMEEAISLAVAEGEEHDRRR